jgi:lipid-binding SYLF domain-containing protein
MKTMRNLGIGAATLAIAGLCYVPASAQRPQPAAPAAPADAQRPPASPTVSADQDRVRSDDRSDEAEVINESIEVLNELTATPDSAIPRSLLERAEAVVVIPSLMKGGFIVGAKHGKGIMSTRDAATRQWSAPAFVNMTGGSIGWQIGAESVDLVLLVMNKQGVNDLLENKFTLGGSASVTAGPVGRTAQASTDAQIGAQILAYSRSQGLFAGAAFEGAKLHADDSDIEDFYGREYDVEEIVRGKVSGPVPAAAETWKQAITRVTGGQ